MESGVADRDGRRGGTDAGGIVSLAKIISEHRGAVEHDLLTETGFQLSDVGRALGWGALSSFLMNQGEGSALMRELHPKESEWATRTKTNAILADIYDILSLINANIVAGFSHRQVKQPKPYPRPVKKKTENERHFGRGALPPDKLRKWFEEKRKENAGSSISDIGSDPGPVGGTAVFN